MGQKKRVVRFRRRRTINIGIVVFVIIFLYTAINVYLYFTKEHMSIYEVQEGSTAEDTIVTGLILRNETIYYSDAPGYISYFYQSGARVSKSSAIYSVDDSQQILEVITSEDKPFTASKENRTRFKYEVDKFQTSYSDTNFNRIYHFKENAQNTVIDLLNLAMIERGQQIHDETGLSYSYRVVKSPSSGIITYYMDSFEGITSNLVNAAMFDQNNYKRESLRTMDMLPQNSPVYKLINSEKWSVIVPLTLEQYTKLAEKERIRFTIRKDNFEMTVPLECFTNGTEYYGKLSLDKYLTNYIGDRYLDLILHFDEVKGLKIPVSAIIEKDFYLVPLDYFTLGADSGKPGLTKETFDAETGEVQYTFIEVDIYYEDEEYAYIDTNPMVFDNASAIRIKKPDSTDSFQLFQTGKLTGVFNVNTGYAVFKRIEPIYQNEAYCIVQKNTKYGLSQYDHIALDASTAIEQAIIY